MTFRGSVSQNSFPGNIKALLAFSTICINTNHAETTVSKTAVTLVVIKVMAPICGGIDCILHCHTPTLNTHTHTHVSLENILDEAVKINSSSLYL